MVFLKTAFVPINNRLKKYLINFQQESNTSYSVVKRLSSGNRKFIR